MVVKVKTLEPKVGEFSSAKGEFSSAKSEEAGN